MLSALGMPEPSLPAYDPAKIRPIPAEAEIRALIAELEQQKAEALREDEQEDDEPEDDESEADNMGDNDLVEGETQSAMPDVSEATADVSPTAEPAQQQPPRRRWRLFGN